MSLFQPLGRWMSGHGNLVLLAMLLVAAGVWGFIALSSEVFEGETQQFDDWAIRALRAPDDPARTIGPRWLEEFGRDMTALGGVGVLMLVSAAVVGYLLLARKFRAMGLVIAATFGAGTLSLLLKLLFDRPRPDIVPHLSYVSTSSFPSGHSMLSSAVYLTLGAILAQLVRRRILKVYFLAVALAVTFLVGVSRVYMGVHYPTDVLAGWMAGLTWAIVCWLVARFLQRKRQIEPTLDPSESG